MDYMDRVQADAWPILFLFGCLGPELVDIVFQKHFKDQNVLK